MRQKVIHTSHRVNKFLSRFSKPKTKAAFSSGLLHFNSFLISVYPKYNYNYDNIIDVLLQKKSKVNVYELLQGYINYFKDNNKNISEKSVLAYAVALKSYFNFYDIDVIPSKFKHKVVAPKPVREDEEPYTHDIIRSILSHCNNNRLKPYLFCLASSGCRAVELLALRKKDIIFSRGETPTKIHIRGEFTKLRRSRDIYISDEATKFLKEWLQYKDEYNIRNKERIEKGYIAYVKKPDGSIKEERKYATPKNYTDDDLVFTEEQNTSPNIVYQRVLSEFQALLRKIGLDKRKENSPRRKYTLHGFRRYVKTKVTNRINSDYSEWLLGHAGSSYYTDEEKTRAELYTNAMRELTFLDYTETDQKTKAIDEQLEVLRKENEKLKERMDSMDKARYWDSKEASQFAEQQKKIMKVMDTEKIGYDEAVHKMFKDPRMTFLGGGMVLYEEWDREADKKRDIELRENYKMEKERKNRIDEYYRNLSSMQLKIERQQLSKELSEISSVCPSCKEKIPYYKELESYCPFCQIKFGPSDEYATKEEIKEYNKFHEKQRTLLMKMHAAGLTKLDISKE